MRFLLRVLLNGVAVFLAAQLIPGIGVSRVRSGAGRPASSSAW